MGATVKARTVKAECIHPLTGQQCSDGVSQLNFPACALRCGFQQIKDRWIQHIAPHHCEVAWSHIRTRLFHDGMDLPGLPIECFRRHDAIAASLCMRHILHCHRTATIGLHMIHHLLERTITATPDQIVGQQYREWCITDHGFCTQHRMPQSQSFGLRHEHRTHAFRQHITDQLQLFVLAGFLQFLLQLIGLVEIVSHRVLVAIGDKYQGVATRGNCLIHRVLDQRPIHDRQHFLGDGLGGGQESSPKAGNRKYSSTHAA